jgi:hypothetical protein
MVDEQVSYHKKTRSENGSPFANLCLKQAYGLPLKLRLLSFLFVSFKAAERS